MAVSTRVSKAGVWLLLGILGVAAAQNAACSPKFHSCYRTRTCPKAPHDDAGAAGEETGGTSGSGTLAGGTGGADQGDSSMSGAAGLGGSDDRGEGGAAGADGAIECTVSQYQYRSSCRDLTVCDSAKEYENLAPTAMTNRECSALLICGAGTFVSSQPTATSDRQCSACPANTFSSSLNVTMCGAWSACKSGQTESVPPNATSDRVCSVCGSGKYESNSQCLALTACQASEYERTPATATSDRKCSALTVCQAGSRQTAAPTATTDRQCAACSSGFSTTANATSCTAWKTCTSSQNLTKAGTSTSDAVCTDRPVCSTAVDRACTVDCPCESGVGVCTASTQCATGLSCVGGSGKKVGRSGDTCLASHCDNNKKDADETSVDCGGVCGCRATFEVVSYKNVPAGAVMGSLRSMNRDGSRFAATIGRNGVYPAAVAADGTVTELAAYGVKADTWAISADGNVILGEMGCANPPTCSNTTWSEARWVGAAAPLVIPINGAARYLSSSGTYIGGSLYSATLDRYCGFLINGNVLNEVCELSFVMGMTKDGKYLGGDIPDAAGGGAGLWYSPTRAITKLSGSGWISTSITAINGTTPVVIGQGTSSVNGVQIGYRWKDGQFTELGVLSGTTNSIPSAVSNDGNTVVGTVAPFEVQQAFIWTDTEKLRYIVDELKARGYEPPSDLLLKYPQFISDDGKTIVGVEVLTPPTFWRVVLD